MLVRDVVSKKGAINPYEFSQEEEDELRQKIDGLPQEQTAPIEPENPYAQVVDEMAGLKVQEDTKNINEGLATTPQEVSEVDKLADEFDVPATFVRDNKDFLKKRSHEKKIGSLDLTNPKLAEWAKKPGNAAFLKEDIEKYQVVDQYASYLKGQEKEELTDAVPKAFSRNYTQIQKALPLLNLLYGRGDQQENIDNFIKLNQKLLKQQEETPKFITDFQEKWVKADKERKKSWLETKAVWARDWEENALSNLADLTKEGLETVLDGFEQAALFASDLKAGMTMAAESSLYTVVPVVGGVGAAALGTAAGAATVAAVGTVAPVPLASLLIGAAGVGAFTGARGSLGVALETAGAAEEYLQEKYGVDINNREQLLKAVNNPKILDELKAMALKKGITIATVDTIADLVGAKLITKGVGKLGKVKGAIKAKGFDIVSEGVGEGAGQYAATGEADLGEMIQESMVSIYPIAGMGVGGVIISNVNNFRRALADRPVQAARQLKEIHEEVKSTKEFGTQIEGLMQEVQDMPIAQENKERLADLLATSSENSSVYMQADDWKTVWGEDAINKADDLLPGGRSDLNKSETEGVALKIPIEDFVTKFSEEDNFMDLASLIRQRPDGMSVAEARTIGSNIPKLVKQLAKEAKQEQQRRAKEVDFRKSLQNDFEGILVEAGVEPKRAKKVAVLRAAEINTLASFEDIDPMDFASMRKLSVQRFASEMEAKKALLARKQKADTKAEVLARDKPEREAKIKEVEDLDEESLVLAEEYIEGEISDMLREVQAATKSIKGRGTSVEQRQGPNKNIVLNEDSTFPKWYRDLKVKNREHMAKVIASKKGPVYARIRKQAIANLIDGYETPTTRVEPSNEFRALLGYDPYDQELGDMDIPFQADMSNKKDLFVIHNLSEDNLAHAFKMGGLAVPSVAVTKKGKTMESFGDISLIAPPSLLKSPRAKTFDADIYSPRYPSVEKVADYKKLEQIINEIDPEVSVSDVHQAIEDDRLKYNHSIQVLFASSRGDKFENRSDYNKYTDETFKEEFEEFKQNLEDQVVTKERLFDGFTPSGNRKYLKHNLENVVKMMRRNLRDGEGFNYGVGSLRSTLTRQFRTIKQIADSRDRIVSNKEFEVLKEEVNNEFSELSDKILEDPSAASFFEGRGFGVMDLITEHLKEVAETNIDALDQYYELDDSVKQDIVSFLDKLANMETEYFEGKIQRAVDLDEFKYAVVPEGTKESTIKELEAKGLDVRVYPENSKQEVIDNLVESDIDILFQADDKDIRGFTDVNDKEDLLIGLLEAEDESTLLHELGHVFLEDVKGLEARLLQVENKMPRQEEFLKMAETLKKELGVKSFDEVTTKQHEHFARLFEAYLLEGKAPSRELKSVFKTFKTWLANIYKNLFNLEQKAKSTMTKEEAAKYKLQLSPEMKDFFDRILATEEEIQEVSETLGLDKKSAVTFFKDVLGIKNTKNNRDLDNLILAMEEMEDEAQLDLYRKSVEQSKKKESKKYKARRKVVEAEVTKLADEDPTYIASEAIRTNQIDGKDSGYKTLKFNTESLRAYTKDGKLKGNIPSSLYSKDGVDPQQVAEILGYKDAETLVNEIQQRPGKQGFINAEVERRMSEEFPDFMDPGKEVELKEEAINSVTNHSEKVQRLQLELMMKKHPAAFKKILTKAAKKLPSTKEIRQGAYNRIQTTPYNQVKAYIFQRMENKARTETVKYALNGNMEAAAQSKLQELFNSQLAVEARDTRERIDKGIKKQKTRYGKSDKQLAGHGDVDILKVAQSIMARYGMLTEFQTERLDTYLLKLRKDDTAKFEKVSALSEVLVDIPAMDFNEMEAGELESILEIVDSLYDLAESEAFIENAEGNKVRKEEVERKLAEQASKHTKESIKKLDTGWEKFVAAASSAKATMTRIEHWTRAMDFQKEGAFTKYLWDLANKAQTAFDTRYAKEYKKVVDNANQYFKEALKDDTVINLAPYFKGLNPVTTKIKRSELIMMLVHSGNMSNKKKLLLGRNMATLDIDGNLNSKAYDAFISDMIKKGLVTKDMMDGVQAYWDQMEEIKPSIQKAFKRVNGYYFNEIEANPIVTPWGEYRGGYAPAVTDPLLVESEGARQNQVSTETSDNTYTFAHTNRGMTMDRVESYNKPLSLELRLLPSHVEKAVRYAEIEPTVVDLGKLINGRVFSDKLHEKNNFWGNELLRPWLARFATQQTTQASDSYGGRYFGGILNYMRRNINMQYMFANFYNTVENLTDITGVLKEVGLSSMMGGLKRYMENPAQAASNITEKSGYMKTRFEADINMIAQEYRQLLQADDLKGKFGKLQDYATRQTYIFQRAVQNVVEITSWNAAYDEGIIKFGNEKKAIAHADSVIRRTYGANRAIDTAKIESGGVIQRSMLAFYSYFLNRYNFIAYSDPNQKLKTYALGLMAPAVLSALLRRAFKAKFDLDDDDEYVDDTMDVLVMSQLRYTAAMIPGGGAGVRFAESFLTKQTFDDRISVAPVVSGLEAARGVHNLFTKDEISKRDIRDAMTFLGMVSGLPLGPAAKHIGNVVEFIEEK